MLPALQAEESINGALRASLGSGFMDPHQAQELQSKWARLANRGDRARASKATPDTLAERGIKTVRVHRRKD